jgi:hypothetical protein
LGFGDRSRPVQLKGHLGKEENMNAENPATNARNTRPRGVGADVPEEIGKRVPTLAEIHRRALEIHIERGGHGCDLDNYLDEWLQAERELQGKYNNRNGEAPKDK